MAVRQADPLQPQQLFAVLQLKPRRLFTGGYTQRAPQQSRAGDPALAAHLVREAEEAVGAAVRGRLADKGSAASNAEHQALLRQAMHGMARGHPAHRELLTELGVRRQLGARLQPGQALPDRLLDFAITGPEAVLRRYRRHHHGRSMYSYLDKMQVFLSPFRGEGQGEGRGG